MIGVKLSMIEIEALKNTEPEYYAALKSIGRPNFNNSILLLNPEQLLPIWKQYRPAKVRELLDKTKCCIGIKSPNAYPSLSKQLSNAVKAGTRIIGNIVQGKSILVSDEIEKQRYSICLDCDRFDKTQMRCMECGCYLKGQILRKVKIATEKCPKGKWSKADMGANI